MRIPPSIEASVPAKVTHLVENYGDEIAGVVKLVNKGLKVTHQVEVSIISSSYSSQHNKKIIHQIDLTNEQVEHLKRGGRIIYVYACGYRLPINW